MFEGSAMDAAALLLLVSGVGVGFGWQPMPDGAPQYEYIVQVEPELLETMANGQAIPIVADVPEHVRPVGRIRIVVGRGEPPRQQLVTQLKPPVAAPAPTASGGVELAQYGQPASAYQPQAPGDRYASGVQPAAGGEWNAENPAAASADDGILPTRQQLFDGTELGDAAQRTWNNGVETAEAAAGAVERLGDGLKQAAQPLREGLADGVGRVDQRVRNAAGNLGDRTKELFNDLEKPFAAATGGPAGNAQWNGAGATPADNRGAQDEAWNAEETAAAPPSAAGPRYTGVGSSAAAPAATDPSGQAEWNGGAGTAPTADPRAAAAGAARPNDPFATSDDPRFRSPANAAASDPKTPITPGAGDPASAPPFAGTADSWGPKGSAVLPPREGQTLSDRVAASQDKPAASGESAASGNSPEVREPMLKQPGNRPLEGVDPREQQPADLSHLAGASPAAATTPTSTTANGAAGQGWETGQAKPAAAKGSRENAAVVIAAWVLLTGSVAGNLYLFWSYLDVRQKYRSLVRKTARAVGSRFSAA
jgi:hypothetical protein